MPKRRKLHMIPVAVEPTICPEAVRWWMDGVAKYEKKSVEVREKARRHMSALGWKFWHARLQGDKPVEFRYESPAGRFYYSLKTACKACVELSCSLTESESVGSNNSSGPSSPMEECMQPKPPQQPMPIKRGRGRPRKNDTLTPKIIAIKPKIVPLKPKKRGRKRKIDLVRPEEEQEFIELGLKPKVGKVLADLKRLRVEDPSDPPKLQIRSPRTVLSSLIDNKVVMSNAIVHYRGRRVGAGPLARGKITREGIKCDCCSKVFALTAFEAHAGSTNHRPGANIILDEDGRSIADCQRQLKSYKDERMGTMKRTNKGDRSDDLCSICQFEGELILCDRCPSSFHASCLGLSEVTQGDWFCPSCCCGACGSARIEQGTFPGEIRKCDQCEIKYHVGCLKGNDVVVGEKWFCSSKCQNVLSGLNGLLGQPVLVGENDLTWALLKSSSTSKTDSRATHRKMRLALGVLHKCFEPSIDPYTQRDLVEDIVNNRVSKLRRLDFRGFYTAILEKSNKEVICVATVRVHGEVAEVPLVATMFKHRRLGMCRILMSELEKQLMKLGVERLVLPSAPAALHTWTNTSMGFSEMTDAEKSQFVNYFFLYFQGTVMCHKHLKQRTSPATEAKLPEENMDLDDSFGGISIITRAEESR